MADPAAADLPENGSRQSVGDLVSLALKDLTRLIQCEIALAKTELRADVRRVLMTAVLAGFAAFAGLFILIMACFAYAYGLMAGGLPAWASFLVVAGTWLVLLVVAGVIIRVLMRRRMTGLRRTRASVHDDLARLRRDEESAAVAAPGAG